MPTKRLLVVWMVELGMNFRFSLCLGFLVLPFSWSLLNQAVGFPSVWTFAGEG